MGERTTQESIALLIGDLVLLVSSLWLTLFFRKLEIPSTDVWLAHFLPFITIFCVSIIVFLVAGLYERNVAQVSIKLPSDLFFAQLANTIFAISFFYFVPVFGINPKLSLFLYVAISSLLLFAWRLFGRKFLEIGKKNTVVLVGNKDQIAEMKQVFDVHPIFKISVMGIMNPAAHDVSEISAFFRKSVGDHHTAIVADLNDPKVAEALSEGYDFLLSNIVIYDINQLYEQTFKRVSVQSINYSWIVETHKRSYVIYGLVKRCIDLLISIPMAIVTFPFFPFVALAIKLESKGSVFITQERVGLKGKIIHMYKFRSMTHSDKGVWLKEKENENKVTKVGYFIRKTRIDELPQLINVIRGDISLIGPRPDIVGLGQKLMNEIPFYMTRYSVLPGLSGWAQIHQIPPQSVEETKLRFAYDLYYVKHRSIFLDIKIALRTIYELLSRNGM